VHGGARTGVPVATGDATNFRRDQLVLVLGRWLCTGQECQKQPSTNTAIREPRGGGSAAPSAGNPSTIRASAVGVRRRHIRTTCIRPRDTRTDGLHAATHAGYRDEPVKAISVRTNPDRAADCAEHLRTFVPVCHRSGANCRPEGGRLGCPPALQLDALIGRSDGPHPTHDGIRSVTDDADDGLRGERWRCAAVRYRRCLRQPGGRGRRS
jgi:hypothetical protein